MTSLFYIFMILSISMNYDSRSIKDYLFILYVFILLRITIIRDNIIPLRLFDGHINYVVFKEYLPLLKYNLSYFIYFFFGNIAWFIPLGFFLNYYKKIKFKKTIIIGFTLSLFIEILQFVFSTGISEFDDLILNSIGTMVGCLIGMYWSKRNERKIK